MARITADDMEGTTSAAAQTEADANEEPVAAAIDRLREDLWQMFAQVCRRLEDWTAP